jgi:hypothetical protein
MSWYEAVCELENYLPGSVLMTSGTGGSGDGGQLPLPLPMLVKGVPLYDVAKAYIQESWGHNLPADTEGWYMRYPMPMRGKRAWWELLAASRRIPRDEAKLQACLHEWAAWLQSSEANVTNSGNDASIQVHKSDTDPDAQVFGKWTIRPGEASFNGGPWFDVDGVRRKLLIRLVKTMGSSVSFTQLKAACGNGSMEDSTLRTHVHDLNEMLKEHFKLSSNPITSVDKAYRLRIP